MWDIDLEFSCLQSVIKLLEDKIQPLIVPAIFENASGTTPEVKVASRRSMSVSWERGAGGVAKPLETLSQHLDYAVTFLHSFGLDPEFTRQVFRQVSYFELISSPFLFITFLFEVSDF